jgi:hypothetical protein
MVEIDHNDLETLAPQLWVLLQHWRSKVLTHSRTPRPDEITPPTSGRWVHQIATIVPDPRAGFVIATCGINLIRRFGRLAGGHRVSALAAGIRQPLARKLLTIRRAQRPIVWRPTIFLGRTPITFTELILPLSDDAQTVSLIYLIALEEIRPKPKPLPEPDFFVPDWVLD